MGALLMLSTPPPPEPKGSCEVPLGVPLAPPEIPTVVLSLEPPRLFWLVLHPAHPDRGQSARGLAQSKT
jgi:hypothetical protein